jgi:hypothetical protein
MRKGLSVLLFLLLTRFVAVGQAPPTLQITSSNAFITLSWYNGSSSLYSLQTTTNLSVPITWTSMPFFFNSGIGNSYAPTASPQQFFRLAQMVPIFQFAIFYNLNMEIDPGSVMTIIGPVFSNDSIWAGSSTLTFDLTVAAVGIVYTNASDPFATNFTGSGHSAFTIPPVSGAGAFGFPGLGTNTDPAAVRPIFNLPPPGIDPYSPVGQAYFINQTDLIISNSPAGLISAYFQDSNNVPPLIYIPTDAIQSITNLLYSYTTNTDEVVTTNWNKGHTIIIGYTTNTVAVVSTNTTESVTTTNYYSFATNTTFYDYREGKTVQAVQLDVGALNIWLGGAGYAFNTQAYNDAGHYIDSVYVYNNAPSSSSSLPSVRMADGAVLPAQGLTVVTPDPLYVLGNYNASGQSLNNGTNVVNTVPAALMGDSITALSTSWSDGYTSSTALTSRTPAATTINAAMIAGIVPTYGATYSGGVENFIRLLEDWSGSIPLTYNGSIVVMFSSQYATNKWQQSGVYYNPPKRNWSFDLNFTDRGKQPPLTPLVVNVITP